MSPLTVIQITNSKGRSGGARQALFLSKGLQDRGNRVVFCAPPDSTAYSWATKLGLDVRPLVFGNLWAQWKASRQLRALAHEVGANIVHAHHTKGHNVALLATFGGRFPPVIANRGVQFVPEFPAKFQSPRTAAIITNSQAVKAILVRRGVSASKIHVVYNGKDLQDIEGLRSRREALRAELGVAGPGPVVGSVGSGRIEKGFQHLVSAAPRISQDFPEARFLLIGSGMAKFKPEIERLGLSGSFVLTGHRTDAWALMSAMDVFVFPSIGMDSCPNVVLEALALELPLVGSDVGGVSEILEGGRGGVLIPPGDPEAIALAVASLLRDPARGAELGREGRRRVETVFTLDQKLNQTLAVYERVLSR